MPKLPSVRPLHSRFVRPHSGPDRRLQASSAPRRPRNALTALLTLGLTLAVIFGITPAPSGSALAGTAAASYPDWGRARAADQALRSGCHRYRYRYRVTAPSDEWLVEIYLVKRSGQRLGAAAWHSTVDPDRARRSFVICRSNTRFGRHKLAMKVTWFEDDLDHTSHVSWVRPTYFRLYRP